MDGRESPRLGKHFMQELTTYSQEISQMAERREGSLENRIEQSDPTQPDHPFARSPRVIRGAEANDIIESAVIRDIPGAKLNAALLRDRVPVILMQAPPPHEVALRRLNTEAFAGKIGWKECCEQLGWCTVYDSCLVVYWDEGAQAHVFHCLSLSHAQFPCVAASRKETQGSIDAVLSSLKYVIGRTGSSINNGVKLRGYMAGGMQKGSGVKGEMAMEGWVNEYIPPKDGPDRRETTYAYYQRSLMWTRPCSCRPAPSTSSR